VTASGGTPVKARRRRTTGRKSVRPPGAIRATRPRRFQLTVLLVGLVSLALLPVVAILFWATRPGPGSERRVATAFEGGEDAGLTAARLDELGLISSPRLFALYFEWFAPGVSVQPGPHLLRTGLTPRQLVQRLGRLPSRDISRVTLPEGYNFLQVAQRLDQKEVCTAAELERAARDTGLLQELGVRAESAEGYLFPATYELFVNTDPRQAVRQMVQETRKRLARLDARLGGPMAKLAQDRGWTEHEVLTLASIVEREARVPEDRPLIAGVFYNRLDDSNFRPLRTLQSDATAAYGCAVDPARAPSCANYRGRVTPEMLRDPKNPYNTYRIAGLPKGPIGSPGEGALEAVLAPAKTDYLYFVADGSGRHRFSRTFEEHRRAITAK